MEMTHNESKPRWDMPPADWLLVSWWCQRSRDDMWQCHVTWHGISLVSVGTKVHLYHSSASKSDKSTSRVHPSASLVDPILSQNRTRPMMTSWCCNVDACDIRWYWCGNFVSFWWHWVTLGDNIVISYRENDSKFDWSRVTSWSSMTTWSKNRVWDRSVKTVVKNFLGD